MAYVALVTYTLVSASKSFECVVFEYRHKVMTQSGQHKTNFGSDSTHG